MSRSPSIIMVHGAFCGGWVFDAFRQPFEAAGHPVLAPDLRGHGAGDRPGEVGGLSMADYASDIAHLCRRVAEAEGAAPVLLGHSMGGLVAQMAARRGPVSALALLAPSAPWGVFGSSLEEAVTAAALPLVAPTPFSPVDPDLQLLKAFSLDRLTPAAREAAARRTRPESARAILETLTWWLDPLMTTLAPPGRLGLDSLVLSGSRDRVHPPATVRQVAERLGGDYREMPGMSHWLPGEPGWEAVAGVILDWLATRRSQAA
ncbi:alpha/beta hydrolase [Phenylobacterium sp.]|uniref:alpha/beta hydrolase n=1 Tax=Phenylobacterium sp. TaxID=1871053 RepID=UPI003455CF15